MLGSGYFAKSLMWGCVNNELSDTLSILFKNHYPFTSPL